MKKSNGTRLAEDWEVPSDWLTWALVYRPDWNEEAAVRESFVFRDYWLGKSGQNGTKVDWLATWRNWIRRAT